MLGEVRLSFSRDKLAALAEGLGLTRKDMLPGLTTALFLKADELARASPSPCTWLLVDSGEPGSPALRLRLLTGPVDGAIYVYRVDHEGVVGKLSSIYSSLKRVLSA